MKPLFFVQAHQAAHTESKEKKTQATATGFSSKAMRYNAERPHWGTIPDADKFCEMTGSCGDTMKLYLRVEENIITDVRFLVTGCVGSVSAAMATGDLIKGKPLKEARAIDDADVFRVLEEIPAKKHHCIQLAVKTLHAALDSHQSCPKPHNRQGEHA